MRRIRPVGGGSQARRRFVIAAAVMAVATATTACAAGRVRGGEGVPNIPGDDLLVLDTGSGIRVTRVATGEVILDAPGGVADPAFHTVATTTVAGSATTLHTFDGSTGEAASIARLDGRLSVRAVSGDGALMALLPPGDGDPWTPEPRAATEVVVADVSSSAAPRRFRLEGNYEPEAFSVDGRMLYLISYVPPSNPAAYRVVSLDLANGKVRDVYGRYKVPPETMSGTRLTQVAAPNGGRLYTLYTNQPAAYSAGTEGAEPRFAMEDDAAFVHTLSLGDGWAFCVDLPDPFGVGDPGAKAIAVSADGRSLYIVDAERGLASTMSTRRLRATDARPVDLDLAADGATSAEVGPDGALYVARGSDVVAVDPDTYAVQRRWHLGGQLTGFAFSPDGARLYAAEGGEIELLDATSGESLGTTAAPGAVGILSVKPSP